LPIQGRRWYNKHFSDLLRYKLIQTSSGSCAAREPDEVHLILKRENGAMSFSGWDQILEEPEPTEEFLASSDQGPWIAEIPVHCVIEAWKVTGILPLQG
jgi:hypothetical protein